LIRWSGKAREPARSGWKRRITRAYGKWRWCCSRPLRLYRGRYIERTQIHA